ncbi:MAG TPA: hypothetical protein VE978_03395 [Chitinophagales bacterium]|nr:hypothetical protein [Chitinophagales bacterium]
MRFLLTLCGLSFLWISCQTKSHDDKTTSKNVKLKTDTLLVFSHGDTLNPVPILSGDLENTLRMYSNKDRFEVFYGDRFVKIFSLNKVKFGIIGDSLFRIYKLDKENFQKLATEKSEMQLHHFVTMDITNDGYDDAVIYDDGGSINYDTKVLVFNPMTKTLVHRKYLDLENLEVDSNNHLLKSWHVPHNMFGGSMKAFYRNTKDSIELVQSILCYNQTGKTGNITGSVLRTTTLKNGNLIRDSIVTTMNNAIHIFDHALWNTSKDFGKKKFNE